MIKKKPIQKADASAEEKIKEAARRLFTQRGFAATKTRDIASEAGINLALLNYYFRSKEKLFDIIMFENFRQFIHGVSLILIDEKMTVKVKIEKLVSVYIDMLLKEPDLPLFIINTMRNDPSRMAQQMEIEMGPARAILQKQMRQAVKSGDLTMPSFDPFHILANMIGLTIFPFVARPLLMRRAKLDEKQFNALMQERKMLIPKWIEAMMKVK